MTVFDSLWFRAVLFFTYLSRLSNAVFRSWSCALFLLSATFTCTFCSDMKKKSTWDLHGHRSPIGHIHLRGKLRPRTPRWYNAALTHTKWMGNPSSPTLSSNCGNRRAFFFFFFFAKPAQGWMCEVYWYPLEGVLCAQIDQGARKETKTFASIPGCLVVKVNDAKTTRKQSQCSAYDNTKKARLNGLFWCCRMRYTNTNVCIRVACFCDSWRKVKAESEADRSDY